MRDGFSQKVAHCFYDFRLFNLYVLGLGKYSAMSDLPYEGVWHALSLDFDQTQLDQILMKTTPQIREYLKAEISRDPETQRRIDFDGEITFGVRARLGQLQKVAREDFVPLVVQEIL